MVWRFKNNPHKSKRGKKVIIRMRDLRAAHGCSRGGRKFCVRHGLDWSSFLKNGVESEVLEKTGDAMAIRVVEVARGRQQQ